MINLYTSSRYSLLGSTIPEVIVKRFIKGEKLFKNVRVQKGIPPHLARTLEQKIADANYKDPAIHYKVNIGFAGCSKSKREFVKQQKEHLKNAKKDLDLEKKARHNKISVSLEEVTKDWFVESAPEHVKLAAEHYGVFQDLFGDAFFYPQVGLDVVFRDGDSQVPVCRGNTLKPQQALTAPEVQFASDPSSLWTLVATNPDGSLYDEHKECLHWFIGNIPGSSLSKGEVVAEYVQPFPARGTGYHRLIFILYKQTHNIDYSNLKIPAKKVDVKSRLFSTYDFYRARQDQLTPAGLAFCQVDWDLSVSRFFHTELDMAEPVFEYDFAPHYHPKQKFFPIRQPFNLYMDRYRDPKQIAKEYLLKKLQKTHPFEGPEPAVPYPNAAPVQPDLDPRLFGRMPSWLKREKLKDRLGLGRISDF